VTREQRVAGNTDFREFTLSEEHDALRDAVRQLASDKIAPRAADIDETGEFPWDVYEALRAAGFHAIHIPEEYGGQGGDALAACIVIEEVARVCAASSLIPAVNKLGTMPLLVGADESLLKTYLPQVASGGHVLLRPERARGGSSDAASMKSARRREGRRGGC
jgi:alkylation response protein AidB-like acyl-CoA dehydrogenase